jgi:hypothetical protein
MTIAGIVPAVAAIVIAIVLARSGRLSVRIRLRRNPHFVSIVQRTRRMPRAEASTRPRRAPAS